MVSILSRRILSLTKARFNRNTRTFLSNAYKCQEEWESRRRSTVFQKIDYDDLYHQLDRSFQIGLRISALDVDLFANGIEGDMFLNELEDILFKLRLNPESSLLRDRTMHAVVRYYIAIGKKKELLNILSNRLNYGIFTDYHAANILMDAFLKEDDVVSAAKVAVLQMLQEDFNHPILRPLSLHSCYKYLNSSEIWSPPKEPEVDEDEDEVKVRVKFIRTPYFDDHFDIVDTNHLVGKTLQMAGSGYAGPFGLSSKVVGLSLYEKRKSLTDLLKQIQSSKAQIHEAAVNTAIEYTETRPKLEEGQKPAEETETSQKEKEELLVELQKAKSSGNLLPGDLTEVSAAELTKAVQENEKTDISDLTKIYQQWQQEREAHIQEEIFESEKKKAMEEIAATKESLSKQEEMVFFFDKEDEWELKVQAKQAEIYAIAEEQKTSPSKEDNEEYIPPDVHQRRS